MGTRALVIVEGPQSIPEPMASSIAEHADATRDSYYHVIVRISDASGLAESLRAQDVTHVDLVGATGEGAVKQTALALLADGLVPRVLLDLTLLEDETNRAALHQELRDAGVAGR